MVEALSKFIQIVQHFSFMSSNVSFLISFIYRWAPVNLAEVEKPPFLSQEKHHESTSTSPIEVSNPETIQQKLGKLHLFEIVSDVVTPSRDKPVQFWPLQISVAVEP